MVRALLIFALATVAPLCAVADAAEATPDWSSDRFLLGEWFCDLTRPGRPLAHERAVYSLVLADHWLKLTYTLTSDDSEKPTMTTDAYESFDSLLKKWVYVSLRSDGDYGMSYSLGWEGGSKTYKPAPDSNEKWRLVATKVSDREFVEDLDIATTTSDWRRASSLRCRKVS